MTAEECNSMCVDDDVTTQTPPRTGSQRRDSDVIDCVVSGWTAWSRCSATCGRSFKTKSRTVEVEAMNGGRKCPKKLTKRRRCEVERCGSHTPESDDDVIDAPAAGARCETNDWSTWSQCSASCGERATQTRTRDFRTGSDRNNDDCAGVRLQRSRECQDLPACSKHNTHNIVTHITSKYTCTLMYLASARDCIMGAWSSWSPCPETTCIQERTRPVIRREDVGGRTCDARIERRVCFEGPCEAYREYHTRN